MDYKTNCLSAFAYRKLILDKEGKPIDYELIEQNEAFEILTSIISDHDASDPFDWLDFYSKVVLTGQANSIEWYSDALGRWFKVEVYSPVKEYFSTLFIDITSFKQTELELIEKNEQLSQLYQELAYKNRELSVLHKALKESERKIKHMAYYDYITELPNRMLFLNSLKEAIAIAKMNCTNVIVICLDLDNFKSVNDTLGHAIGDALLIETSERLLGFINKKGTVARLSGDEFALFIENVKQESNVIPILERIKSILKEPFWINENLINLTASIGVSIYPDNGESAEELINNADTAMYRAKQSGKNGYRFFSIKMKENILRRINIELLLKKALINNEFLLYYQPQYYTETGRIRGFEALIRWNSPEIGFLNPIEFIPIAEESGLIIEIGEWVLNTASRVCKKFQKRCNCELIMAVNISPIQLKQKGFQNMVLKVIESSGLKPTNLELEVTENILIDSYDNVAHVLRSLNEHGVGIALDDFGTGYSSLSYLRKLPINLLKIDKAFIQEIGLLNPYNELTESIISLVHKLNIKTMAEGVETLEQLNYLIKAKCDLIQGFYLGKPVPEDRIGSIIESGCSNKFGHLPSNQDLP